MWKTLLRIGKTVLVQFIGKQTINLSSLTNGAKWKNSIVCVYGCAISKIGNYLGFVTENKKLDDNSFEVGCKYIENKRVLVEDKLIGEYSFSDFTGIRNNSYEYVANVKYSNLEGVLCLRVNLHGLSYYWLGGNVSLSVSVNGKTYGTLGLSSTQQTGGNWYKIDSLPTNTFRHYIKYYKWKQWSGGAWVDSINLVAFVNITDSYESGENINIRVQNFNYGGNSIVGKQAEVYLSSLSYIDKTNSKQGDANCLAVAFEKEI